MHSASRLCQSSQLFFNLGACINVPLPLQVIIISRKVLLAELMVTRAQSF